MATSQGWYSGWVSWAGERFSVGARTASTIYTLGSNLVSSTAGRRAAAIAENYGASWVVAVGVISRFANNYLGCWFGSLVSCFLARPACSLGSYVWQHLPPLAVSSMSGSAVRSVLPACLTWRGVPLAFANNPPPRRLLFEPVAQAAPKTITVDDCILQKEACVLTLQRVAAASVAYSFIKNATFPKTFCQMHSQNWREALLSNPVELKKQEKKFEEEFFTQLFADVEAIQDASWLEKKLTYGWCYVAYKISAWIVQPFLRRVGDWGIEQLRGVGQCLDNPSGVKHFHDQLVDGVFLFLASYNHARAQIEKEKDQVTTKLPSEKMIDIFATALKNEKVVAWNDVLVDFVLEKSMTGIWYPLRPLFSFILKRIAIVKGAFDAVTIQQQSDSFLFVLDQVAVELLEALDKSLDAPPSVEPTPALDQSTKERLQRLFPALLDALDYSQPEGMRNVDWGGKQLDRNVFLPISEYSTELLSFSLQKQLTPGFVWQLSHTALRNLHQIYQAAEKRGNPSSVFEAERARKKTLLQSVLNKTITRALAERPRIHPDKSVQNANDHRQWLKDEGKKFADQVRELQARPTTFDKGQFRLLWKEFSFQLQQQHEKVLQDERMLELLKNEVGASFTASADIIAPLQSMVENDHIDLDSGLAQLNSCLDRFTNQLDTLSYVCEVHAMPSVLQKGILSGVDYFVQRRVASRVDDLYRLLAEPVTTCYLPHFLLFRNLVAQER